jgi:hypothetical protein
LYERDILIAMMVLSVIEAAAALTASIKGCHFVCLCCRNCCCEYDVTTTEQVPLFLCEELSTQKLLRFTAKYRHATDFFLAKTRALYAIKSQRYNECSLNNHSIFMDVIQCRFLLALYKPL